MSVVNCVRVWVVPQGPSTLALGHERMNWGEADDVNNTKLFVTRNSYPCLIRVLSQLACAKTTSGGRMSQVIHPLIDDPRSWWPFASITYVTPPSAEVTEQVLFI